MDGIAVFDDLALGFTEFATWWLYRAAVCVGRSF
jgi:hypothetical protein